MSIVMTADILRLCTLINYGVLLVWFLAFRYGHDGLYALHRRWFRLTPDSFDTVHYAAMAVYKIAILMFNLVPWLALMVLQRDGT